MDFSILALVFALGLRHGLDADHLAIIDGFARLRPSRWNGVLFALGHGGVVTVLALGVDRLLGEVELDWLSPWLFLLVAGANLYRLLRPAAHTHAGAGAGLPGRWLVLGPLAMGVLLAIGFETVTQLSALSLANQVSPLLLGAAFTFGMLITDGVNGLLAARVQRSRGPRAESASRVIGWLVVAFSTAFAFGHFAGLDLGTLALPLGVLMFSALVALRLWCLRDPQARLTVGT
ncbi:nickel transporter [Deinococcus peraridilitoris]|nr:nickel transporter [Deinococcus peraridilitoris]